MAPQFILLRVMERRDAQTLAKRSERPTDRVDLDVSYDSLSKLNPVYFTRLAQHTDLLQ